MVLSITPNSQSVSLGSKCLIFLHEADFGAGQEVLSISAVQVPARPHPVLLGPPKGRQSRRHGTEVAEREASTAETQVSAGQESQSGGPGLQGRVKVLPGIPGGPGIPG